MKDSSTALQALNRDDLYLELSSGRRFYLTSTTDFYEEEIAHALALQTRYGGHCRTFYSVAQHTLLVAEIMRWLGTGDPFEGLHHDDTEHILVDMPSPVKAMLPEYKVLELSLDVRIRAFWNLPAKITEACKRADYIALYVEADTLITTRGRGECWPNPDNVQEAADDFRKWGKGEFDPANYLCDSASAKYHWLKAHEDMRK